MPLNLDENLPTAFPTPDYLKFESIRRGVITLINETKLPKNAAKEMKNLYLVEDGQPAIRPGVDWFGVEVPNGDPIQGYDYFDDGTIHLVVVAGGVVYRSLDDGATWTECTGATFSNVDDAVEMNQNGGLLYLTQAGSSIIRYDGTTTLQVYSALTTPAAPTVVATGGGTTYTYYYKIAAVNLVGFSVASTAGSVTIGAPRSTWDATTNFVTLTLPAYQTDQTRYDIYFSEDNINFYYLASQSKPNLAWKDDGTAQVVPSTLAPTGNTTEGPEVARLRNVGVRQYGVGDPNNKYRIWFTGAGNSSGSFSSAYDGGYIDWQPGGKFFPMDVEDYRSGKGDPVATVWCDSADGQGCILQMSLDTLTIGDVSITLPSIYQLPGSRGTPAPRSVINVLNDYFFYNSLGIYNLGSRAQFLNVLSTDEASANIRPNFRRVSRVGESGISSAYFEANVYFSLPVGSDTNNQTAIYNTEMQAWMPEAFMIGFSKFLRYTDQNKGQHLLALKPGDSRLSEISTSIQGDYGQPFATSFTSGLISTTKDRWEFQFVEEMEMDFSNPQAKIYIELIGIDRARGLRPVKTVVIDASSIVTNHGWDIFQWDVEEWDDTSVVPETFSESSAKRYTTVQRELNAVQWHIYTDAVDSRYVLRSLQTWGTPTQAGHPPSWRVNSI
jgi:hypothetical protein